MYQMMKISSFCFFEDVDCAKALTKLLTIVDNLPVLLDLC